MILAQAVAFVAIILCMQTAMAQGPAGCICYSNGGSATPTSRAPCTTPGCSANATSSCKGDVSLFLFYNNVSNANPTNPSTSAARHGGCSCPGRSYHSYSSAHDNAYYSAGPSSSNNYYNITSCADFGNIAAKANYSGAAASSNGAVNCCIACCESAPVGGD